MLQSLGEEGKEKLHCGSNVKRLLSRLSKEKQEQFWRYQYYKNLHKLKFTLIDLSAQLRSEATY